MRLTTFNILAPTDRMKWLQHCVNQETFSHCDRITDKTLPILFPMENVRSEAALLWGSPLIRTTEDVGSYTRFRRDAPPAKPPPIASEKSTQGYHDITATLVDLISGDPVRFCQITMRILPSWNISLWLSETSGFHVRVIIVWNVGRDRARKTIGCGPRPYGRSRVPANHIIISPTLERCAPA